MIAAIYIDPLAFFVENASSGWSLARRRPEEHRA
jgi:hypothetical protein